MARPRSFDRAAAVERAMKVFREHGYDRASTATLERTMEIGRSSFYAAFGSKDDLYVEAMELYLVGLRNRVIDPLGAPGPAGAVLSRFFRSVARRGEPGNEPFRCCMVVRASVDGEAAPARVREIVAGALAELDAAFLELLKRGRADGTIDAQSPLRARARLLTTTFQGLNIAAGAGRPRAERTEIARAALDAVGCTRRNR